MSMMTLKQVQGDMCQYELVSASNQVNPVIKRIMVQTIFNLP